MPRKALKKDKPPLLFVEQPVRGARLQNVPEVRAALNPKEFFSETQAEYSSTLTSWVSCLFFFLSFCIHLSNNYFTSHVFFIQMFHYCTLSGKTAI